MENYGFPDNVTIQGDGTERHPFTATPINTPLSSIRTNRTVYQITAPDVAAGFANIPVLFAVPFADVAYTIAQAITQDGPLDLLNDFSPGDNHLIAPTGFTAQIYVNAGAVAGTFIVLNTIAVHD